MTKDKDELCVHKIFSFGDTIILPGIPFKPRPEEPMPTDPTLSIPPTPELSEILKLPFSRFRPGRKNTSGFVGVDFHKGSNKWRARITINRRNIDLGFFNSFEAAVEARVLAEKAAYGEDFE